jgi:hypothetical protein
VGLRVQMAGQLKAANTVIDQLGGIIRSLNAQVRLGVPFQHTTLRHCISQWQGGE